MTLTNAAGGFLIYDVVDGHVADVTIDGLFNKDDAYGYGLQAAGGTANLTITGLTGRWSRCLFTTLSDNRNNVHWGGPRNVRIVAGIGEGGPGSRTIWHTHEYGTNIQFIGCYAANAGSASDRCPGFRVGAANVSIVDCVAVRNYGPGVHVVSTALDTTIEGGELAYNGEKGASCSGKGLRIADVHIHHNGEEGVTWGNPAVGNATIVRVLGCDIHDNGKPGYDYGIHSGVTNTEDVVIAGNIIPKSSTQTLSLLRMAGTKVVIANNILMGYGPNSLGDYLTGTNAVKSFNTVDPPP